MTGISGQVSNPDPEHIKIINPNGNPRDPDRKERSVEIRVKNPPLVQKSILNKGGV